MSNVGPALEQCLQIIADDRDSLDEFANACDLDWLQHPPEFAALKSVLSTCLVALDFRISWELTHEQG